MSSVSSSVRRWPLIRAILPLALSAAWLASANLAAQSFKPGDLAPAPSRSAQPASLEARTQALNDVFHDYWQDTLKRSPMMASAIGDHRYDDQLSDYSVQAYNAALERGLDFIERLGAIDTTGMSAQEKLKKRLLVDHLVDQQESSVCKPWQTPVTQSSGIQVDLPALVEVLRFASADDYYHYIARLDEVPAALMQISTDLMLGEQVGRSEPQSTMRHVLAEANEIASVNPDSTPFAYPLHQFPSGISQQQQAEIRASVLTAIRTKVQPAYLHFARYLAASYIPKANPKPGAPTQSKRAVCNAPLYADSAKVVELRLRAQKALGKNFDLQAFHNEIVDHGAVPSDILEQRVNAWIEQQQNGQAKK